MFYKNNSFVTKTFYGVTFQPGEVKEVPGYINNKSFDIVAAPNTPQEPPKVEQPTKSELPKETAKPDGRRTRKKSVDHSILISTETELEIQRSDNAEVEVENSEKEENV